MTVQLTDDARKFLREKLRDLEQRECADCGREFLADPDEGEITCGDHL